MGQEKQETYASYRPMPHNARFWLHSEHCYTEAELRFREWVLKVRAESGIHEEYRATPCSWFAEDEVALINPNEHSWFFASAYTPRHRIHRDDFHVQPIDSQRLQWHALYDLMQRVGDYLLLRNSKLPEDHLNQPMNFVLLDVNAILKGLSQNPSIEQVQEQLEQLTRYLRTLEKNISPLQGSDRLFLANFRNIIDSEIHPQFMHKIESRKLQERLSDLSKTINKLSTDRNRILHFALNARPANPHPYTFSTELSQKVSAYPTQAAQKCKQQASELADAPNPVLLITMEDLKNCPDFQLISMDEVLLDHYAHAISDLHELYRFQKVITQTMDLLSQAGEVYTLHQFKIQMLGLLNEIEHFIDASSQHIIKIMDRNTQEYHKAIAEEQSMTWLKKWFSSAREQLQTYIKNQDTLAQFPSSRAELVKTRNTLKEQVHQVAQHLGDPKHATTNFETITEQAHDLNNLMSSMHLWIKQQHEMKGLSAPIAPKPLPFFSRPDLPATQPIYPSKAPMALNATALSQPTMDAHLLFQVLLALIPFGVIALCLFYHWHPKEDNTQKRTLHDTPEAFESIKSRCDEVLLDIQAFEQEHQTDLSDTYAGIVDSYTDCVSNAESGQYDTEQLAAVLDELTYLHDTLCPPKYSELSL